MLKVDTELLNQRQEELESLVKQLEEVSTEMKQVNLRLKWDVNISSQVRRALDVGSDNAGLLATKAKTLSSGLNTICSAYVLTEMENLGLRLGILDAIKQKIGLTSTGAGYSTEVQDSGLMIIAAMLSTSFIPELAEKFPDLKTMGSALKAVFNPSVSTTGHVGWTSTGSGTDWAGSLIGGTATISALDGKLSGTASGDLLGAEAYAKSGASFKKGEANAYAKAGVEGYVAKGELEGSCGLLSGKVEGTALTAGASGEAGVSLFKNGEFAPEIYAKAEAEATALEGSASVSFGNEDVDAHLNASGKVATAEAHASAGAGMISYKDSDGVVHNELGVEATAGASAYAAQGTVSGGFEIFGVKIDLSATGGVGGAGAEAGGRITSGGASGEIGLGVGVGAKIKVNVDWSGAAEYAEDAIETVGNVVTDVADAAGDFLGGVAGGVADAFKSFF